MHLAIVIPIYNEQENLPELHRRLNDVFAQLADIEPQVIYVNDGSTDDSLALMLEQHAADGRFAVLDLSRNFGHQPAISAGLAHVQADAVVVMDGDLQDPPEVIVDLVQAWRAGGQVVRAERRSRPERGVRRLGYGLFYRLLGWVSDFPIPARSGVFGLLDRQALDELNRLPEKNRFLPGLRAWIGFDQRTVFYDRKERAAGVPKQSFVRLVYYALDGLVSFSYKPLRLMVALGALVSAAGFALALAFVIRRLLGWESAQTGFTTLVTLMLFLGGIQLIAIGLLGEYLGRIYDEVKQRPLYIVKQGFGLADSVGARSSPSQSPPVSEQASRAVLKPK